MKPLIVANWKCNPTTPAEAKLLFNSIKKRINNIKRAEVVICPPFIYLPILSSVIISHQSSVKLGAQDCFWEEKGAYTGEISPLMLKNLGVKYVIVGHSERRKHQKETDEMIEKKLKLALSAGLKPILCIDKLSQLPRSIKQGFSVAYEPLFAIGTGKACSPERAEKMRIAIKNKINVPVLYGGSVNSKNAEDYIKKAGFNGLLVGGASLKSREFIDLVRSLPSK